MNKKLQEFIDQVRECDKLIEEQEELREDLYKRIDEILEQEEQDIISLQGE
jgi:superfamily I DNA/RNA helicase